ncbi:DUF3108 domain-containing protein [candidate division WOR-3 bacterium]|nr:DUF3108 domain-containing protein [candidate division WOR-3 bacterium]
MKYFVFACLLLLLISPACRKAETGLRLSPPDWQPETLRYVVLSEGEPVGSAIQYISPTTTESGAMLEFTQVTATGTGDEQARDSSWLLFRADNLRPVHSFRTVTSGDNALWSEVSYSNDQAAIQAMTPMGARAIDLDITPTDFDNDQLTTLLRALEVGPQDSIKLGVVVGLVGSDIDVTVNRVGLETVTVPAGSFETRRLQLDIAGQVVDLWYETGGRRRLVRYEAPGGVMVMELAPAPAPEEAPAPPPGDKPPRTGR